MLSLGLEFHNKIAKLSVAHYKSLPKSGKPTKDEWTVLATIIKEDVLLSSLEVVSLGTGSKCIGANLMSKNGDVLNDSHAEIICRRGFLRYLYEQIDETLEKSSNEIFVLNEKRLLLKPNVKFHFFTSHVPCGDAAIFLKQDDSEFGHCLKDHVEIGLKRAGSAEFSNTKRQKIDFEDSRTGGKCLPEDVKHDPQFDGNRYHVLGAVRTKPGRGDRTLSVSCSDKLAKWTCLGVQGALLSLFIDEPIYLSSFTIANQTLFNKEALHRALYGRLGHITLNFPYKQNIMSIRQAEIPFDDGKNNSKHPCPSSIIWCKTKTKLLEIGVEGRKQGVTKKSIKSKKARLSICKIELFRCFLNICDKNLLKINARNGTLKYIEAKLRATEYQQAWNSLKCDYFKVWTKKDFILLDFKVD